MGHKAGAARGDVHLPIGPFKAAAIGVGLEGLHNVVLFATLVQKHQGHPLPEGPLQQRIKLASHHHEVQRQVRPLAGPVPVEVGACAEPVAAAAGVEGLAEDGHRVALQCLPLLQLVVCHLPDELAVVAGALQQFKSLLVFIQLRFVNVNVRVVFVRLPFQSNCKEENRFCRPQSRLQSSPEAEFWYLKRTNEILTS